MDLHNLLGKQIEDIGCLIDPITNETSEDTFLQIKEGRHCNYNRTYFRFQKQFNLTN